MKKLLSLILIVTLFLTFNVNVWAAPNVNSAKNQIKKHDASHIKKAKAFTMNLEKKLKSDPNLEKKLEEFSEKLTELENKTEDPYKFAKAKDKLFSKYPEFVIESNRISLDNAENNSMAITRSTDGDFSYWTRSYYRLTNSIEHSTTKLERWMNSAFTLATGFISPIMPYFYAVAGPMSEGEFREIGDSSTSSREKRLITEKHYDVYTDVYHDFFTFVQTEQAWATLIIEVDWIDGLGNYHDEPAEEYTNYRLYKSLYYDDYSLCKNLAIQKHRNTDLTMEVYNYQEGEETIYENNLPSEVWDFIN